MTVQIRKREFRNIGVMFSGRVGEHSESAICTAGKPVWRLRHVRKRFFVRVCMSCEFAERCLLYAGKGFTGVWKRLYDMPEKAFLCGCLSNTIAA